MSFGIAIAVSAFLATLLGTYFFRELALRHGIMDVPNARSSHTAPTPRGGGVAIVATVLILSLILAAAQRLSTAGLLSLLIGGTAVAIVGLLDDRRGVSPLVRLIVHVVAAAWAVMWLGGLVAQPIGLLLVDFGWIGAVFCVMAIAWMLNLFNFMDGIDGIVAAEAIFICVSGAMLITFVDGASGTVYLLLGISLANLGFLVWNWAPAKIFLGDAGSGFIGYVIAVVALMSANETSVSIWTWLILSSLFVADATLTLLRRMLRGERWHTAHRMHAYQWLSRRWGSHSKVATAYTLANVLMALPAAFVSVRAPQFAAALACGSLIMAGAVALACGAGRREDGA